MLRKIKTIIRGQLTTDGAGVKLRRVIIPEHNDLFDPYLLMDFFDSKNPDEYTKGFPWHPHRGIETITFLFSGSIEHGDSLGNKGIINGGDCQWMTAGSGIIHQEMPIESPHMLGIQLWANLPSKSKMIDPKYRDIKSSDIPVVNLNGTTVKVVAGKYGDIIGVVQRDDILSNFLIVEMKPESQFIMKTSHDDTAFGVLVSGSVFISDDEREFSDAGSAVLYENGDEILIKTGKDSARLLIVTGRPINEPVAWGGPIVMNTNEELKLAFKEYREGTFLKKAAKTD
ncbi:UNVERIFIED_CONTAM: hypothetical protein Cloal_3492 [Acetivibrio alkalicellulosi]